MKWQLLLSLVATAFASIDRCFPVEVNGDVRCGPYFFIIGTFKSGTTSLYSYLSQHPGVKVLFSSETGDVEDIDEEAMNSFFSEDQTVRRKPTAVNLKETNFFTYFNNSEVMPTVEGFKIRPRTLEAYVEAFFPVIHSEDSVVTGEASPSYLYSPQAASKLASVFPEARLLALLRHPLTRAYSRIAHALRLRCESNPNQAFCRPADFDELFESLMELILPGIETCLEDIYKDTVNFTSEHYYTFLHCETQAINKATEEEKALIASLPKAASRIILKHQILLRLFPLRVLSHSFYVFQIQHWLNYFTSDQMLIMISEKFFQDPVPAMNNVENHLGLEHIEWSDIVNVKFNVKIQTPGTPAIFVRESLSAGSRKPILSSELKARLQKLFCPYNELLGKLLGFSQSPWEGSEDEQSWDP